MFLLYVFECFTPVFVCAPQKPEEGVASSGIGVTDGYKGYWELNMSPKPE